MRILVVSDIHSRFSKLEELIRSEKADILAVCGDITDFRRGDVNRFVRIVEGSFRWCLFVHGNCDYEDSFDGIESENLMYIHGKSVEIGDVTFHGLGGSTHTPFNTPSEYDEDYYRKLIRKFRPGKRNILISHSPPYGVLDRTHSGVSAGSLAIRESMEMFDAVFCGHIHEARGIERVGRTIVLNTGTLSAGEYGVANPDRSVRLMKL